MRNFMLQPTSTAQWHALVCEAESRAHRDLSEDVENYLVILLERFLNKPEISSRVMALDYLKGLYTAGRRQFHKLRDVGDICLLHAGFFPRRARRQRVSTRYYIDLGVSAYYQLYQRNHQQLGGLFHRLTENFIPAMDVLMAMQPHSQHPELDPLHAYELWESTDSTAASRRLEAITHGTLIRNLDNRKH